MASVTKRERSKYWYACFTTHDGRQLKKSTGETDRDKAMTIALALERAEELAGRGAATEATLRQLFSRTLEDVSGGEESIRSVSVRKYLKDWIASKKLAESSRERYEHTVDLFLEHLGERAKKPLSSVTPAIIQDFVTTRTDAGIAPKTLVVDVKTLNTAFNRAKRHNLILHNPVEAVELPKLKSSTRGTFAPAEVKLVLDKAPEDWRTAIMLGFYTGARLGDCAAMKWDHVNLTDGTLRFDADKTDDEVLVPMHRELYGYLEKLASQDKAQTYLAPSLAGRKTGGAHGLSAAFMGIMRDAGIDPGIVQGKGKRKFSKRSFHALRHSFNSALANAGVSQELRMKLTGHASEAMNTGYTHHELETLKAAVDRLPALI